MACTLYQVTSPTAPGDDRLRRSLSSKDLHRRAKMRRSYSENHLCHSIGSIKASNVQPKLKNSRSVGFFNIPSTMIPDTLKLFLFDPEASKEMNMDREESDHDHEDEVVINEGQKRANWIERIVELRNSWKGKQDRVKEDVGGGDTESCCDEEGGCEVEYEEDGEGTEISIDRETFSSLLRHISWSDAKVFSKLAFLCNMAYVIPDIKTGDLRRYCGLEFVTSSLEKKAEAEAIKEKLDQDSTIMAAVALELRDPTSESAAYSKQRPLLRSSAAYEIAASAASYVQSRAKDLMSDPQLIEDGMCLHYEDDEEDESGSARFYKPEVAACVAASTMTAVVAAGEKQKDKAAMDLQSLHSSPCEWFVCDDSSVYTRCFVIQGSDSLASWQANLFFEPTKFEVTNVLVHRGIYEAAKGIYNQFMPEIKQHLNRYGNRAKLQFTGHSLGGSLALLVHLMLLTRKEVKLSSLLPVVTFGSPFVFCGGQKMLDQLGLDEDHIHCVMMHRDIVPRAFSCSYPDYVAQVLKRLNGTFQFHPCLNKNKLLYSPMGKIFILQPDEKLSPPHPLLPQGSALYALDNANSYLTKRAVRAFLNSPHPIETLSDPTAYGSEGTIIRDHDSSNYLKAVNEVIRQHTRLVVRKARKQRNPLWPLLAARSPHAWSHTCNIEGRAQLTEKLLTGV
ncbi:hypothetical protein CDL12_13494 [Handroanthus impetiginosus]|uniref:Fungal lipase-type domain-containing protein n=1 Tax=Handroanthus impetiginosus TaxID=429701 RepID=A0A2G9H8Q6_9LAMI|nr:hypothetical protein CDL12_13494 [Handroanthus impetiginosus]